MKRKTFLLGEKGLSALEMIVSMSILVTLALAGTATFNSSQELLNQNSQRMILQTELRKILDTMAREIREASPSGPVPLTSVTVTPGVNSFGFAIPDAVANNTVTQWKAIRYFLCPDTARSVGRVVQNTFPNNYTCPVAGQTTIGTSVQSIIFTHNPGGLSQRTIRIQITGIRSSANTELRRDLTAAVTGEVVLRNP